MSDYKRLTNKNLDEYNPEIDFCSDCKYYGEPNGCNRPNGTCANYDRFLETYNRLNELEDKIEDGMLVELPCKVCETCYIIMGDKKIKEAVVINFSIEAGGIYAKVRFKEGIFLYTSIPELSKTYEQAKEKLKELKSKE